MSYDYTVLAGTQGHQNHRKKDRLFEVAEGCACRSCSSPRAAAAAGRHRRLGVSGLDCLAFDLFARLSGLVPLVGITPGRCFAGNAALLGCCDVVIATAGANIGMGGPAMIEGGGLGVFPPEEIGPIDVQGPNGVVDVAVADEAEAVAVARRYLSYFQGPVDDGSAPTSGCSAAIPENRLRSYDVRAVIDALATPARCWSCGSASAAAWSPRSCASRDVPSAWSPTTPRTSAAPSTRRRRQGGPLPPAVRRVRPAGGLLCDTPGSWSGPRSRGPPRPPLQPAVRRRRQPHGAVRDGRAAQGATASARRRWPVAGSRPRCGWPGRPASRGHGPRGRGAARLPRELDAIEDPASASGRSKQMVDRGTSTARRSTRPRTSRSTT